MANAQGRRQFVVDNLDLHTLRLLDLRPLDLHTLLNPHLWITEMRLPHELWEDLPAHGCI